jgi:hypothetical protein
MINKGFDGDKSAEFAKDIYPPEKKRGRLRQL